MKEITVKDVLQILRKWLILIILVPIAVAGAVAVFYYQYADDEFTAQSSMYVLIRYEDTTGNMRVDTTTSTFFTSDFRELFNRSPVVAKVEEQLGIASLKEVVDLKVTSIPNTRIVEVTAAGKDPVLCADVANTASTIFKAYIEEFMRVDSVSITQPAVASDIPSGPPRMRNTLLALAVSLLLCVGGVLLIEMLNTRIVSSEQIEEELKQPLLGTVLDYRKDLTVYMDKEKSSVNNLYRYLTQPVRESVKTVAMNIGFTSVDRPVKCIAMTSATPNEGKSSLSILLASAFAEEGKTTLIVDTDFRKPTIGRLLKRRNRLDLLDYLAGKAKLSEIIQPTSIKNTFFIDSTHSAALLSRTVRTESFSQFLSAVRNDFDMIIFDTPPLGMFVDTAVLATQIDGVVVVISDNRVEMRLEQNVLEQLKRSGATTLGVVHNFVKPKRGTGYYTHKYGSNYYYGQKRRVKNEAELAHEDGAPAARQKA